MQHVHERAGSCFASSVLSAFQQPSLSTSTHN